MIGKLIHESKRCLEIACANIYEAVDVLQIAAKNRALILTCGNGGSASTAAHFAQDLPDAYRAIPLTESGPRITSLANDIGFEEIFERQLWRLGEAGGLLVVFSVSGTSPNVVKAVIAAKNLRMGVLSFTGSGGGVQKYSDAVIEVPSADPGLVEGIHLIVSQFMVSILKEGVK